ncbi:MAG: hypothetical protein ACJAR8_001114, partial [Bacteroidia bacterium]
NTGRLQSRECTNAHTRWINGNQKKMRALVQKIKSKLG